MREEIIRTLIERLVSKGMEITSIPPYIRAVAQSIVAHRTLNLEELNKHLQTLGWENSELDEYTLFLIIATLESDFTYNPDQRFGQTVNPKDFSAPTNEKKQA